MDDITEGEIYNPYIRLYQPNGQNYITMNSTSFGEEGQENLIFPGQMSNLLKTKTIRYFPVKAVIIEQNRLGHKRPQFSGQVLSEILLGYLSEDDAHKYFISKK